MLELEAALERILASVPPPKSEYVQLIDAHQRIVLEKVVAKTDLPPFDNSSMDGYAVRAADVGGATRQTPVSLKIVGKIPAGETFTSEVRAGQCVRIFTGSVLPRGADAVIMQEDTRSDVERPEDVLIFDAAKPWENVRFRGEDVKQGAIIAKPGDCLGAAQIALLAAGGVAEVTVGRRPLVALLATGSELKEAGDATPLAPGQIYDSNRLALASLIQGIGAPRILPIVRDDPEATGKALADALAECDAVVTSGGVSVGEMDFVKSAFVALGGRLDLWKVSIKPGRPFAFGSYNGKILFGLPGNPISAFVTFLLLVRPALLRWQGATKTDLPASTGVLAEPLANPGSRRHFVRVFVDDKGKIRSAGTQASHILSSLAGAHGLVDVPPGKTFPEGSSVRVLRWE